MENLEEKERIIQALRDNINNANIKKSECARNKNK